jgi:hypothetical protein
MTNLADTFTYLGPVNAPSFPANVSTTAPANPTVGALWFNPTSSITSVWDGTVWVTMGGGAAATVAATAPVKKSAGDFWLDTSVTPNVLKVWTGTAWMLVDHQPTVALTAPAAKGVGNFWLDTTANPNVLHIWDGTTWIIPAPVSTIGNTAPTNPTSGMLWLDTTAATQPVLKLRNGTTWLTIGNVVGPATSTDNAVARFDGTTGKIIQNSGVIVDDTNNMTVPGNITVNGNSILGNAAVDTITANASTMTVPNGLNIDANTLVIDAAKNRVGVGVAAPAAKLDIDNGAVTTALPIVHGSETWNAAGVSHRGLSMDFIGTAYGLPSEMLTYTFDGRSVMGLGVSGTGTLLEVTDISSNVMFEVTDKGISTAYPTGATRASSWRMGNKKTATVPLVASTTDYVEIEINGAIVKLAVVA